MLSQRTGDRQSKKHQPASGLCCHSGEGAAQTVGLGIVGVASSAVINTPTTRVASGRSALR